MTASNINAIAAPLRKLVIFEVIVTERGHYEIQKIAYHKNFKQPLLDLARLDYMQEGAFPELPREVYERYEQWRIKSKMNIYPQLMQELNAYMQLKEANEKVLDLTEFEGHIVKRAGAYIIEVPPTLGQANHKVPLVMSIRSKNQK
jgi:hypothetical protein